MNESDYKATSPVTRLGWLDGLRGWAILSVVGIHVWIKHDLGIKNGETIAPDSIYLTYGYATWGVQLFYMISGFTMCYMWQYYRTSPHRIRDFFIRRFFRIAPMMYLTIVVSIITKQYENDILAILLSFVFMTDFAPNHIHSYAPAGTTIDLEFTFYLLFPLLVPYMHRWWLVGIFAIINIGWSFVSQSIPYAFHQHFILSQAIMFVLGGYTYHLIQNNFGKKVLSNYWICPTVFVFIYWFLDFLNTPTIIHHSLYRLHFMAVALLLATLLVSSAYTKMPLFDNKFMRYMGVLSFSIYLLHPTIVAPISGILRTYGGLLFGVSGMVLTLIPTVLVCMLSYKYIEKPGIRLGKKLINTLHKKI